MSNQTGEDELRAEILTEFKQVHKLAPADYTENCTNVVMSIIRTEKLKLLAEVRERVVGEDRKEHSPYCGIGCPHDKLIDLYRCTCGLVGSPRNKQLEALTKLEAEL